MTAETGTKLLNKLSNKRWQAFIAFHRTLLHEHSDFSFCFLEFGILDGASMICNVVVPIPM
jgi:hypothetical protein